MGQSTILAANTTAATSTDVVVTSGTQVTIGLFSSEAVNLPLGARFNILMDTPGGDQFVATLDNVFRQRALDAPGTYRVSRNAYSGAEFGVYTAVKATVDDLGAMKMARLTFGIADLAWWEQYETFPLPFEIIPAQGALTLIVPQSVLYKVNNPDSDPFSLNLNIGYLEHGDQDPTLHHLVDQGVTFTQSGFSHTPSILWGNVSPEIVDAPMMNTAVVAYVADIQAPFDSIIVQPLGAGSGFAVGDTGSFGENAGAYSTTDPQYEVTAVDENGAITGITLTAHATGEAVDPNVAESLALYPGGAQAGTGDGGGVITVNTTSNITVDITIPYYVMTVSDAGIGQP